MRSFSRAVVLKMFLKALLKKNYVHQKKKKNNMLQYNLVFLFVILHHKGAIGNARTEEWLSAYVQVLHDTDVGAVNLL